ncbi:MAG: hypothetical protein B7Y69_07575 [Sphingobacteriia bacterium 35-40-8]|nr:MAG: hypothetical protein B7Y69_07575 [Sphingobacteriia bacterium 35-40-8]
MKIVSKIFLVIILFAQQQVIAQSLDQMQAKSVRLPNGWSLTPVGRSMPLGDLPLNMILSKSGKLLAVTNNGQGVQSIQLIDPQKEQLLDSVVIAKSWYGLAFSSDEKFLELIANIKRKGKNSKYDCVIGLSGGLDSSYLLHVAVKKYGLRPLVFHVDGGWNTEAAVKNIHSLVEGLGLELITDVINWKEMRDLQLAFFRSGVPHIDLPQDHAFIASLYKFALKHKVKYILPPVCFNPAIALQAVSGFSK